MSAWQDLGNFFTTNRVTTLLDFTAFLLATPQILGGKKGLEKFEIIFELLLKGIRAIHAIFLVTLIAIISSLTAIVIVLLFPRLPRVILQVVFAATLGCNCLSFFLLPVMAIIVDRLLKPLIGWALARMEKDEFITERWLLIGAILFIISTLIKFWVG